MNKRSAQSAKVPKSRFNIDSHYHENLERPGSFTALGGYFLDDDMKAFDPSFFGISPIEAMWMDPQQRKLLEVVYECFESSGLTLEDVNGSKTSVFVGSFTSDFQQMSFREPDFRHNYAATGVDPGIISNRISHVFNLVGPRLDIYRLGLIESTLLIEVLVSPSTPHALLPYMLSTRRSMPFINVIVKLL